MIPLIEEDEKTKKIWGSIVEGCFFCATKTRHWHENTNNPLCEPCAKIHKVGELPDHGKEIRRRKRLAKKQLEHV